MYLKYIQMYRYKHLHYSITCMHHVLFASERVISKNVVCFFSMLKDFDMEVVLRQNFYDFFY